MGTTTRCCAEVSDEFLAHVLLTTRCSTEVSDEFLARVLPQLQAQELQPEEARERSWTSPAAAWRAALPESARTGRRHHSAFAAVRGVRGRRAPVLSDPTLQVPALRAQRRRQEREHEKIMLDSTLLPPQQSPQLVSQHFGDAVGEVRRQSDWAPSVPDFDGGIEQQALNTSIMSYSSELTIGQEEAAASGPDEVDTGADACGDLLPVQPCLTATAPRLSQHGSLGRRVSMAQTYSSGQRNSVGQTSRFSIPAAKRLSSLGSADGRKSMDGRRKSMARRPSAFASFSVNQDSASSQLPVWWTTQAEVEEVQQVEQVGYSEDDFRRISRVSRMEIFEVKDLYEEFKAADEDGQGMLTCEQLEEAMRRHLQMDEDAELPPSMGAEVARYTAQTDVEHLVSLEQFCVWASSVAFTRQAQLLRNDEKSVRDYAKQHRMDIREVERALTVFRTYDVDGSNSIEKEEFDKMICSLLRAKSADDIPKERLKRFWSDIDRDGDGQVNFEEFFLWYLRYFPSGSGGAAEVYSNNIAKRLTMPCL